MRNACYSFFSPIYISPKSNSSYSTPSLFEKFRVKSDEIAVTSILDSILLPSISTSIWPFNKAFSFELKNIKILKIMYCIITFTIYLDIGYISKLRGINLTYFILELWRVTLPST